MPSLRTFCLSLSFLLFLMLYIFTFYLQVHHSFWVNFGIKCEVQQKVPRVLVYGCSIVPAPFVESIILFCLHGIAVSFVSKISGPYLWGTILEFLNFLLLTQSIDLSFFQYQNVIIPLCGNPLCSKP